MLVFHQSSHAVASRVALVDKLSPRKSMGKVSCKSSKARPILIKQVYIIYIDIYILILLIQLIAFYFFSFSAGFLHFFCPLS